MAYSQYLSTGIISLNYNHKFNLSNNLFRYFIKVFSDVRASFLLVSFKQTITKEHASVNNGISGNYFFIYRELKGWFMKTTTIAALTAMAVVVCLVALCSHPAQGANPAVWEEQKTIFLPWPTAPAPAATNLMRKQEHGIWETGKKDSLKAKIKTFSDLPF
jgi:hypothetical protein